MKHTARLITSWIYVFFLCITVVAQTRKPDLTGNLSGSIADAAEAGPIKYAFVLVHGKFEKGDITVTLDEHGKFDLRLAVGLYDVFVAADGFSPTCKRVEITAGRTTAFDVKLKPDSEHLQSNVGARTLLWGIPDLVPLSASVVHRRYYRYDAIRDKL